MNMHGGVGKVLHDFGEQLAGEHGFAFFLYQSRHGILDGKLKIGCLKRERVAARIQVNARQNRQRRARSDTLQNDGQGILQFRLVDAEFQAAPFLLLSMVPVQYRTINPFSRLPP